MRAVRTSLSLLLAALLIVGFPQPVLADALASKVDSARSPDLPILTAADSMAAQSAAAQAKAGKQFHTNLNPLLSVCASAGEVVGVGPNLDSIFTAFRNSPLHWDLITSSQWTSMGTGMAATSDGALYVSVVFCAGAGGDAPTPPAAPPAPNPPPRIILPPQPRSALQLPPQLKLSPCWGDDLRDTVLHEPPWETGACPGLV